jgi:SAM-dependent methyltransferase
MGLVTLATRQGWSQGLADFILRNAKDNPGNFHRIYRDPKLKAEFHSFLKNVYNIYPEDRFHELIARAVEQAETDQEVYAYVLANLRSVKPFLSELTYALPALAHQKLEITQQTLKLLGKRKKIDGYLEIGTPGRYVGKLEDKITLEGKVYLVNGTKPGFSPVDIMERGQLFPIGEFIPLGDYAPIDHAGLRAESLDVVTNYVGLHHCPLEKLDAFIASIHRPLKKGGSLILRDHDVDGPEMNAMVALAHDVFNCGLNEPWDTNHKELRFFRSLTDWVSLLKERGFEQRGAPIYQNGDPTRNALMEFVKV